MLRGQQGWGQAVGLELVREVRKDGVTGQREGEEEEG